MERQPMHDLPTGPDLLSLARDVLLSKLLPLLPPEAHLDARLVANSMAIATREAAAGKKAAQELLRALQSFYAGSTLTRPALRAGSPLSRSPEEGAERSAAGQGQPDLLGRFAHDLRVGNFERSATLERSACAILWQLTIGRLRQANPRFLAANGFS
jgi:uncharacterized protein DUF6285